LPDTGSCASESRLVTNRVARNPVGLFTAREGYMNQNDDLIYPPTLAVSASLLTERDLCARLRLSPAHVQGMRRKGTGPRFVRLGKAVRYPESAVADWLAALIAR